MLRNGCTAVVLLGLLATVAGTGVAAESTAELLEKGVYTEETVGDLDGAIEIYTRIVNDAGAERPFIAQALYRLGSCLLKTGKQERARAVFQQLVEEYPDQAEPVARAREHLPAQGQPPGKLAVGPAPWEDGELLRFSLKTPSGGPVGDLTYSVRSVVANGKDAWRVESYMGLPKHEIAKYVSVEADRDSFLPINATLYHTQLGTLQARFRGDERRIKMNRPGGEPEGYDQKLVGATYDNEQAVFLVRRLPLAEGYTTSFLLSGRPGVTATADLRVLDVETVTVPAGTFECFKTELGTPPRKETHWISTDANRYLVKVANSEIVVELTEITRLSNGPARYLDEQTGLSLTAPRGWDIMKSSFKFGEHNFWLLLFSPELKAKAVLVSQQPEAPLELRDFANQDIGIYKGRRPSYSVREESWAELEVAGAPAVSLLADLEAGGETLVEQRVYVQGPSAFYFFVFRAEPDVFETMKDDFDAIVDSLNLEL